MQSPGTGLTSSKRLAPLRHLHQLLRLAEPGEIPGLDLLVCVSSKGQPSTCSGHRPCAMASGGVPLTYESPLGVNPTSGTAQGGMCRGTAW